jgi:hypothetical protein
VALLSPQCAALLFLHVGLAWTLDMDGIGV